ncbi:putative Radical SAM domain protein [Acetoanaerobium sticklandii]|uniref:Putative Radical SAM domain protein n=1 Tax=Acetoanaerobium sticklandii (strain ATCC 12662 / DSM 519 / JCM 1433 / CCUG 9281 / NCIMB 10654 / HF) TaxID=499177 RepID=E3PRA9_ACESD|nr:radical SAM protein [Acetoanaerobium sticklandii]CBH20183.1 putative Radical SAM domain protein [Acetoanaerobium sticklandii]
MYTDARIHYPLDEMTNMLIPVTIGCSYNKCAFCNMYKGEKFAHVSLTDIKAQLMNGYKYTEKVFLVGAEPLSIGYEKMKELLELIHEYLPYCALVSSYASIKNISMYTVEQLSILHDMGLRQLYIGFESGLEEALILMKKGHTVNEAIEQAQKLNKAGLLFNSIIMYGIAGKGKSVENALATAKMLSQFKSHKIITMNLQIFDDTDLAQMVSSGNFIPADRNERLLEIKTLLEKFNPIEKTVFDTTHPTNIVKLLGTLPDDKAKLLAKLD